MGVLRPTKQPSNSFAILLYDDLLYSPSRRASPGVYLTVLVVLMSPD